MIKYTEAELGRLLNQTGARVSDAKVAPIAGAFGRGFIASVSGTKASVSKGTIGADPTDDFEVPPFLQVAPGDHVWYYEVGSDRLVVTVLDRNSVLPDDVTIKNLTLTGRLLRRGVVSPPAATGHEDDLAPDNGSTAYWWRLDATGAYEIRGAVAEPDAEHVWVNISTFTRTIKNEATGTTAIDRILTPSATDYLLGPQASVRAWYDALSARWRLVAK